MKIFFVLITLFLATHLYAADSDVYKITLKDGREITGKLEEVGLDRYKIHMVFKGRVMGTMDVTAADIVSKKLVPAAKPKETVKKEEEKPKEETAKKEEPKTEAPVIKKTKSPLREKHKKAQVKNIETYKELDGALINLKVRAESTSLKDGIDKNLKMVKEKLAAHIKAYKELAEIDQQLMAKTADKGLKELAKHHQVYLQHIEEKAQAEISKSISSRAKSDFVIAWLKDADLSPIPDSFAGGDKVLVKQVALINKRLAEFDEMRKKKKVDYKKVLQLLDHHEYFAIYADSRK